MIERSAANLGMERALEAEREVQRPSNLRSAWEALFKEARGCTRCDLYRNATQTVSAKGHSTPG